jgi:TonB family protein
VGEAIVSPRRILAFQIVLTLAAAIGIWSSRGAAIQAQSRIPRLTRSVTPQNPVGNWPRVGVTLRVTVDERGNVSEVRPFGPSRERYSFYVSTPMGGEVLAFTPLTDIVPNQPSYDAFVTSAVDAVRQWRYDTPADGPVTFDIIFGFKPPSDPRLLSHGLTVDARANPASTAAVPAPPLRDPPPDWMQGAVRVGGDVAAPTKVKNVELIYPPIALSARVSGVVTVDARVEPNGRVSQVRVVSGPPLLQKTAADAVMQWEFTPTVLNGKPVPVLITTTLEFTLMEVPR